MEDFDSFCKKEKQNKALELQNTTKLKTGFIASRLNRDNFWNLIFGLMLFLAWTSGFLFPQPFGGIMLWLILFSAIILIKYNTHLTFDKEELQFTTSHGAKIRKVGLFFLPLIAISFCLSALLVGFICSTSNIKASLFDTVLFTFFLAYFPSLYCILRNFPIGVYFHKNAWHVEGAQYTHSTNKHESLTSPRNMLINPINSWYSGNIHHRK